MRQFLAMNDSPKKLEIEIVRFKKWLLRGEKKRLADRDTVLGQDPVWTWGVTVVRVLSTVILHVFVPHERESAFVKAWFIIKL